MRVVAWLSLVTSGTLLAACGGFTNLGDGPLAGAGGEDESGGDGGTTMSGGSAGKGSAGRTMGTGGTGMGTGGTGMGTGGSAPGSGGTGMGSGGTGMGTGGSSAMGPCTGRPCGSTCALGVPLDGDMPQASGGENGSDLVALLGYCSQEGACGAAFPICPTTMCMSDGDCPPLPAICEACPDGSYSCPKPVCVDGACAVDAPGCGNECETSMDCAVAVAPCEMCPDGSSSCPTVECVMGHCTGSVPGCGNYDPCEGLACGDRCSACEPGDMGCAAAPAVLSFCNDAGTCQTGIPSCGGGGECMSVLDCPVTNVCYMCQDGGCGSVGCEDGRCTYGCPNDPVECKENADCGIGPAICQPCDDGSCAVLSCLNNRCELACAIGGLMCDNDDDCPSCGSCGNLDVCGKYQCVEGRCDLTCPGGT